MGRPLRVERRRQGVSIGLGQLPRWTTPARALPPLNAFTANFMLSVARVSSLLLGQRTGEGFNEFKIHFLTFINPTKPIY